FGLVIGLHLGNELGVAPLRFDDCDDALRLAARISNDQAMRDVRIADAGTILHMLDSMLLDENPTISAVVECPHKFVSDLGMIRQCHFRWRKTAHPLQRLDSEDCGEIMLPRR